MDSKRSKWGQIFWPFLSKQFFLQYFFWVRNILPRVLFGLLSRFQPFLKISPGANLDLLEPITIHIFVNENVKIYHRTFFLLHLPGPCEYYQSLFSVCVSHVGSKCHKTVQYFELRSNDDCIYRNVNQWNFEPKVFRSTEVLQQP